VAFRYHGMTAFGQFPVQVSSILSVWPSDYYLERRQLTGDTTVRVYDSITRINKQSMKPHELLCRLSQYSMHNDLPDIDSEYRASVLIRQISGRSAREACKFRLAYLSPSPMLSQVSPTFRYRRSLFSFPRLQRTVQLLCGKEQLEILL
jgi:hypothetical protein